MDEAEVAHFSEGRDLAAPVRHKTQCTLEEGEHGRTASRAEAQY